MLTLYNSGYMTDPSKFVLGVVTSQSTSIIVEIADPTKFAAWGNANLSGSSNNNSPFYFAALNRYVYYINVLGYSDVDAHMAAFLDTVADAGLKVFYANSASFNKWTPITTDNNGNIITDPC